MYPNYPHDTHAQIDDTTMRAVEGFQAHLLIETGTINVTTTANTPTTVSGTYTRQFTANTTPSITGSISNMGGYPSANIKNLVVQTIDNKTYQVTVLSDTTQTVTVSWQAIGQAV